MLKLENSPLVTVGDLGHGPIRDLSVAPAANDNPSRPDAATKPAGLGSERARYGTLTVALDGSFDPWRATLAVMSAFWQLGNAVASAQGALMRATVACAVGGWLPQRPRSLR